MIEQTKQPPMMKGMVYILEAIFGHQKEFLRYETVYVDRRKNYKKVEKEFHKFVMSGEGTYKIV